MMGGRRCAIRGRWVVLMLIAVGSWGALTAPGARATFPGADGRIVFSYEAPVPGEHLTQADLYSMNPDGTGLRRLTATPHRNEFAPTWNATGTSIAYWRTRAPFGPGSIWVMDADGSNRVGLTSGRDARDPVWSPNGRRLAFSAFVSSGDTHIYTMRAVVGGRRIRITSRRSLDFEPAWSPDGTRIAFTRAHEQGDVGDIWVIDLATGDATQATSSPAYDHQVSWSSAGVRLVFERVQRNVARIATVRADGTGLVLITSGHFDADPVYSPSAGQIAFASDRGTSFLPDLWLMDANGANAHRILNRPYASTTPDWQAI